MQRNATSVRAVSDPEPASVVQRAIAIVEAVARAGDGVSLVAVALAAGVPKPTAYRLLRELADAGLVRRETTGRQAQVDFAHFEVEFDAAPGQRHIVWLFSLAHRGNSSRSSLTEGAMPSASARVAAIHVATSSPTWRTLPAASADCSETLKPDRPETARISDELTPPSHETVVLLAQDWRADTMFRYQCSTN